MKCPELYCIVETISLCAKRLWVCCQLLMPSDEKLEEFWIDFNVRSHSISFYFSLADEEVQIHQIINVQIKKNFLKTDISKSLYKLSSRHLLELNKVWFPLHVG